MKKEVDICFMGMSKNERFWDINTIFYDFNRATSARPKLTCTKH